MHLATTDLAFAKTLDHLARHWETRRQAAQESESRSPHAFSIALAREAGTQGTMIAREVGRRLGWPVYDHELLERVAQELGVHANLLESLDEKRLHWMLEAFESFAGDPTVSESAYVQHLIKTMLALGAHGECIIVGRGAAFVLPIRTTLRVRLVAPLNWRTRTLALQQRISDQEAQGRAEEIDRERRDSVWELFRRDATAPENYDLVLNVSGFSVASCVDLILETLRRRQIER